MAGKSMNKVMILGNLGKDPEVRYLPSGQAVANFSVATNERFKDKDGNWKDRAEWHKVVLFGKTAEVAGKYLSKGRQVFIEGRIQTREWEKDGQKRYTTEIVGLNMILLGGGRGGESSDEENSYDEQNPPPPGDEDIPF